jgi:hypothetical protein
MFLLRLVWAVVHALFAERVCWTSDSSDRTGHRQPRRPHGRRGGTFPSSNCAAPLRVDELLRLTRLHEVFETCRDEQEALGSFKFVDPHGQG